MKLLALSHHSPGCNDYGWRTHNYFVFQANYEFFLVTYCGCLENLDHLDFKMKILNHVAKKKRGRPSKHGRGYISKSEILKDVVRKRKIDILLGTGTNEICYNYSDNAGKDYCMIRRHSFLDYVRESTQYLSRYRSAVDEVENSKIIDWSMKKHITKRLWDLYYLNSDGIEELTDIQMITLTDLLSKHFVKILINDNNNHEQLRYEASA